MRFLGRRRCCAGGIPARDCIPQPVRCVPFGPDRAAVLAGAMWDRRFSCVAWSVVLAPKSRVALVVRAASAWGRARSATCRPNGRGVPACSPQVGPSATLRYWNGVARRSEADARDAIPCGFRGRREFDAAGREDAGHLVLPFVGQHSTVVDIGCGIGRILKWVAPACERAIGLDVSREMLRLAGRHLGGFTNVQLHLLPPSLKFPLGNRVADFAYFYHVSEHLEREQCFAILRETARCLKLGGAAPVSFSVLDFLPNRREFTRWAAAGDREGVRSRFYSEPEALTLLSMVGLHPQLRLYVSRRIRLGCDQTGHVRARCDATSSARRSGERRNSQRQPPSTLIAERLRDRIRKAAVARAARRRDRGHLMQHHLTIETLSRCSSRSRPW